MTKMTVLHFASPFAFSMPVQAAPRTARGAAADREDAAKNGLVTGEEASAPLLAGADTVSWLAMDAPVGSTSNGNDAAGLLDRVRRRYAEQADLPDEGEDDEAGS